MTEALPACVIDYLGAADSEEDIVVTEISREQTSTQDRQQLEKWKQNLRIKLIREQFEAENKSSANQQSILHRLLNLP